MSTYGRRLTILEQQIPLRCPQCKTLLECSACHNWKDEARRYGIDPESLIRAVSSAIDQLAGRSRAFD